MRRVWEQFICLYLCYVIPRSSKQEELLHISRPRNSESIRIQCDCLSQLQLQQGFTQDASTQRAVGCYLEQGLLWFTIYITNIAGTIRAYVEEQESTRGYAGDTEEAPQMQPMPVEEDRV